MTNKRHKPELSLYVPLLLAGFAFVLFVFSAPNLIADFILLGGNPVHEALLAGDPVSDAQLSAFLQSREKAALWHASNAMPAPRPDLEQALAWQMKALSLSPADTYGWSRLAYIRILTEGLSEAAAEAFMHSIEAAPYEPRLMISRINMAVLLGNKLTPDIKEQIPQMIRETWVLFPKELAQSAQQGHFISAVDAALKDNPETLAKWKHLTTGTTP